VSNRFVRIRSPLLRAIGDWSDPETPGILRRRRAAIAGIAALAAALVLLTHGGLWPLPALDLLYVLHDYLALPFWGYTWTLSGPYSITWWSLAGIALVIWLATFLTRRSAVRGPHARLCRLLVHFIAQSTGSSRHVTRLTAWVDWLAARTLDAELLEDVVRLEQADALTAIVGADSTLDEGAAWRLVRLTDLLAKLTSHAGAPARERWRSLAIWHQALMWIDHRAGAAPRPGAIAALFSAIAATGRALLDRLDSVDDVEGDALASALRRDLHCLVEYASAFAPGASARGASAFAQGATADKSADKSAGQAERAFMRSVLERLDQLWALAERGSNDEGASTLTAKAPDGVIEAQGILVASIGLHAASRENDVHLAEAHLQAFEALSFVGYLRAAGREGSRVARALTAEAPERDHYRLVADIAERRRARRADAPSVGRALLDEAASYERMRIDGLHDASGPDFASAFASAFALRATARQARPSAKAGRDLRSRLLWRIRHRPLPLRMRVDPVLLGGLAAAAVGYCAATATLVLLIFGSADSAGWSARSLPDRRLLENVRRGLDTAPFLDAIFHAPDRQLIVSQQGGVLHSYDPATGLWSTTRPFRLNDLARPDIRLLSSSTDERSGALWGVTADGGLVRRLNGRWQVIVGDTKFLGRRGTPVQQAELSAVAASSDGKWLLAAAGTDGVGVQDIERRRWLSRDEISPNGSPAAVTHAVWWRDRFYVGGPEGVSELAIDRPSTHSTSSGSTVSAVEGSTGLGAGRPLAFRRVKGLEGRVVALEATPAEGLFVHQEVPCENGSSTCARLSRMTQPFMAPSVLIDERNRYTELSLDRLFYATQWKDRLLLAGSSGIFDYDTRLHGWKKQAGETISAVGPCAASPSSASCFYYGYGGRASGVALFTPKTMTGDAPSRWPLAGEQPTRIAAEAPGTAAVLTAAGRAYALAPGAISTLINPATSSPVPLDRYHDAVTFGDKVLFFGQPGALLHDIVRRSYSPLRGVPRWLRSPASIVASSGAFLFGLERQGTSYDAYVAPQQQVELGTLYFNTSKPFRIDGPVRAIDASQPDVLRLVDGNGRVQSISAAGVTALTGGRSSAMNHARLLDVAGKADWLAASTAGGVRLYDMRTRSWSVPLPAPVGERASELAEHKGAWIARSEANRLVRLGAVPSILIGGGDPMPRRQPTDALQAGSDIYLSWPGTIQRYDQRSRQVVGRWTFDVAERGRLAGVIGSEPLSLAGGVARAGVREIARGVRDMFTSGPNLWLTREDPWTALRAGRGRRYLEARPLASLAGRPSTTPSCLFRTPSADDAGVLHDVRRLSNGLVAVTTDAGLKLHSRDRHSWYGVAGLLPNTGRDRLATIGSALIVWDLPAGASAKAGLPAGASAEAGTLQIVRSPVTLPDSCSTAPTRVDRAAESVTARAIAIDERAGTAYVVRDDGSVDRVDETVTRPMIARESQGPPEADVVRAWHFPDLAPSSLWVATRRSLWQYDLEHHSWFEIALETTPRTGEVSIDLDSRSGEIAVFVTAGSETFRGSVVKEPGRQSKIELARSSEPRPAGDRRPSAALRAGAQSPVFRIGAVTFFRDVSHGLLATMQLEDGRSALAYQNRAFAWDRGRRGIAIGREGPLLLTEAGIHAAGSPASFSSFDPGPPGAPSPADRLTSGPDLVPRVLRGNRWYRRVAAGVWEPAPPPSTDAVLADDDGLVWRRRNGSIVVESVAGAPVSAPAGAHGAELSTDRLIDAAPYGGGIALLTPGFVELPSTTLKAGPSTVLRPGAMFPAPPGDTLESETINGQEVMWLTRSGSAFIWNVERRTFEPPPTGPNPFERRTLAEIGPLRLTRVASERSERATGPAFALRATAPKAERGARAPQPVRRSFSEGGSDGVGGSGGAKPPGEEIEGAVQVADLQGQLSWMPIDLSTGRFPFDVVRSVAVVGNTLYVGTDAGLQAYDGTDVSFEHARLITLPAGPSAAPPRIERVGESCVGPGTAVACGPRGCARQVGSTFVAAPTNALSCRLRARSPFWAWQVDGSGLSGRYVTTSAPGALAGAMPVTLANGQLAHDDVGQVVSFGGSIFTVWQSRFVSSHPTGLALAGASNHAFAAPVRLLRITAPVPMVSMLRPDGRDLAPGLYAIEGSSFAKAPAGRPRVWRYQKQAWTIVTDAAETATIADYARNPPLLQRKRLRLVRHAPASAPLALRHGRPHTAPAFEMRMPPGAWMPLAWDASVSRYALDVWQDIAVHQKTLWVATPAGLMSLDGQWSFNPDTFRVLAGPSQEAGRTATDLRVDGSGADVRYDGARAYRVAIDGLGPRPAVRLERDPFAEQTFDVDARYWAWRITGRTASSAGRLAGTWKGEPIAVANGRFDFDAVNSLAVFQGLLHVATNTRGWFALPVDSAALERLSRPTHASIAPLDVAKLHGNRDPDEPELCLQGADGQFARLSPNGVTRRTQGCPVVAARTGFWRYTRDGPTLRVLPAAGAGRPGERVLVDGRFTDEVITGAPVTGMKNRRVFTLVPTSAGVMWWDATGRAVDMHAPPFQGKPDGPRLLQWTAEGPPAYVADGTLYSLENDDKPRSSWTVRLPPKAIFERLGSGPGPLLSIDWSEDGRRHHTVVDPRNGSVSHDDIPIDARKIPAYFRRAMTEQSQDGLIRLRLRDHVVSAYATSEGWPIVETDDSFQVLAGVSHGSRAILVGPHHLIELNMDRIARAVYSGGSPPAPPGSETKR
jgi:hypothetical protein